jgi:hypothetical protein
LLCAFVFLFNTQFCIYVFVSNFNLILLSLSIFSFHENMVLLFSSLLFFFW